jgi:hypothetical protein
LTFDLVPIGFLLRIEGTPGELDENFCDLVDPMPPVAIRETAFPVTNGVVPLSAAASS